MPFDLCTEFTQAWFANANISRQIKSVEINSKPMARASPEALKLLHIVEYL